MDWSEGFAAALDAPVEVPLEVPPSAEIDVVVCPHCDCTNCEVWNSTNSRLATCPECAAEFMLPEIAESSAKAVIIAVTEAQFKKGGKEGGRRKGAAGATDSGKDNEKTGSMTRKAAKEGQMPFV